MTDAGLKPQLLIVNRESTSFPQLLRRLRSPKRPTAFFTLNNVTTTDVLHALQRENISVPRGVAIIGFGDFDLAALLAVPLTARSDSPPPSLAEVLRVCFSIGSAPDRMLST